MRIHLSDGTTTTPLDSMAEVPDRLAEMAYAWLDVEDPPAGGDPVLRNLVAPGFASWITTRNQPARCQWDGKALAIGARAKVDGAIVEVNVYVGENVIISVHQGAGELFDLVRHRIEADEGVPTGSLALVLLLDDLLETFRPQITALRGRLYDVGDDIVESPSRQHLTAIFDLRRELAELRLAIVPYADAVGDVFDRLTILPGLSEDDRAALQSHARRAATMVRQLEAMQDGAGHAMESYVSMVTTRQGQVINWLALVSVVFLPLTFLTGFFGMNFGWLVDGIDSASHFWFLGVVLPVAVVAVVVVMVRRLLPILRGDMSDVSTAS